MATTLLYRYCLKVRRECSLKKQFFLPVALCSEDIRRSETLLETFFQIKRTRGAPLSDLRGKSRVPSSRAPPGVYVASSSLGMGTVSGLVSCPPSASPRERVGSGAETRG